MSWLHRGRLIFYRDVLTFSRLGLAQRRRGGEVLKRNIVTLPLQVHTLTFTVFYIEKAALYCTFSKNRIFSLNFNIDFYWGKSASFQFLLDLFT